MEGADEVAAATEAALGLNPQAVCDDVLDLVDDAVAQGFEYCLKEAAAPGVLGAARAAQHATEVEQGLNAIFNKIMDGMDKRMANWVKYCLRHCFSVPEGFVTPGDDHSCAKELHKDGTSDSVLDVELDSLRKKLESANKESENLRREMSSLGRQTTFKRKFDSSLAEVQKLLEDKCVQANFEGLAKAVPILQEKVMQMNKKITEAGSLADQQVWSLGDNKRLALDEGTGSTKDIQDIINILQNK